MGLKENLTSWVVLRNLELRGIGGGGGGGGRKNKNTINKFECDCWEGDKTR